MNQLETACHHPSSFVGTQICLVDSNMILLSCLPADGIPADLLIMILLVFVKLDIGVPVSDHLCFIFMSALLKV